MLLDTHAWAVARQWPVPVGVAALLWVEAELAVFSDTLAPAVKLSLCICARHQLPQVVQVRVCLTSHACAKQLV